jgi:hypothetical protein
MANQALSAVTRLNETQAYWDNVIVWTATALHFRRASSNRIKLCCTTMEILDKETCTEGDVYGNSRKLFGQVSAYLSSSLKFSLLAPEFCDVGAQEGEAV